MIFAVAIDHLNCLQTNDRIVFKRSKAIWDFSPDTPYVYTFKMRLNEESITMLKQQIEPYKEFARPYYVNRDSAHDFRHIKRIISRLDLLSKEMPPCSKALLCFLACFHGLKTQLEKDELFRDRVKVFLQNLTWNEPEIEKAFSSLKRHTSNPQTVEEQIVHDANYVELLGALGIAKAFTTGGAYQQTYEETANIFEYRYLDKVKFVTPVGKRIAKQKRAYTKSFLKQLRSEL